MPYYFFQWNDEIVAYIGQHGITPEDFEHVVTHPISVKRSRSTGWEIAMGFSLSGDYTVCIYEWIDRDTIEPITAYHPSQD
jgi:hypothetical protein